MLEQMAPGQVVYNTPSAHRLRGPMDLDAFERAFSASFFIEEQVTLAPSDRALYRLRARA